MILWVLHTLRCFVVRCSIIPVGRMNTFGGGVSFLLFVFSGVFFFSVRKGVIIRSRERGIYFKKKQFSAIHLTFFLIFRTLSIFNYLFSIVNTSHHAKSKSLAKHYTLTATTRCAPKIKIDTYFEKVFRKSVFVPTSFMRWSVQQSL